MRAQPDRTEDKKLLQRLSDALDSSYGRLRLDECGDWNIFGKDGHISTDAQLWYLYISPGSARKWNNVKKKLSFMELSQDGDEEGILKLERMPTEEEAEIVRKVLHLRKRVVLSEDDRAELVRRLYSPSRMGVSAS